MDTYGWKTKLWKFNEKNCSEKKNEKKQWVCKWKNKYLVREIFVNNAYAVEYKLLMK